MSEVGKRNSACAIDHIGLKTTGVVRYNFGAAALYEESIRRGEARLTAHGALVAETGQHTGRSPKDKFVVRDGATEPHVWWDNNKAISPAQFDTLLADFQAHAADKDLYVQDLVGGADAESRLPTRVITEFAWHSLFIRNLLIRPDAAELEQFVPEMTIIDLPSFRADPLRHGSRTETVIAVDLSRKIVLIGGTSYAGEMKKSVFTMLNYLLPAKGVMPMHCSANEGAAGDAAIFFGLSGTGKTTLSADPSRTLIGDDEHGWGPHGIFNFEGGCYAKTIKLSAEAEPEIFATTQ
ncbi:MAG: phosphoenolpyruvate carboxykinase (ATP), partial [Mesorhizobium sp.]